MRHETIFSLILAIDCFNFRDYFWSSVFWVLSSRRLLGAYADVGFFSDKQGSSVQEKFKQLW